MDPLSALGGGGFSASSSASAGFGDQSTRAGNFNIGGVNLGGDKQDNIMLLGLVLVAVLVLKK